MPHTANTAPWSPELCQNIIAAHAGREGALLPVLHDLQDAFGFIPPEATPIIAAALNVTRAEVHGTISFYHDFREVPAGRRVVRLCQAEACQARGGRTTTAAVERGLGLALGETSANGDVTLEPIYCLGLCASGPAALVDGRPVGRLDGAAVQDLIGELSL